jgi:hypothetical protein
MAVFSGNNPVPSNLFNNANFPAFPKPPTPPAPAPTGSATNDQILKRLHAIETQMIKNMTHTEAVVAAAVKAILAHQSR